MVIWCCACVCSKMWYDSSDLWGCRKKKWSLRILYYWLGEILCIVFSRRLFKVFCILQRVVYRWYFLAVDFESINNIFCCFLKKKKKLLLLVWKLQVITYSSILNFQKYYIIKCNFISWEIEKLDVFSSTGSRKWILIEIISTKSEFKVKWFLLDIFLWKWVE
jgi:hypothetical protein